MTVRTLLGRALTTGALAALATAAPAQATGHHGPYCAFHPICDKIAEIVHGGGSDSAAEGHNVCHTVEQQAPWLLFCHS